MEDPGAEFLQQIDEEQLEALIETMYLVAFSDGELSEPEQAHFAACVAELTLGRMTPDQLEHVLTRVIGRLREGDRQACIASLKDRLSSQKLQEVALMLAGDMAAADGVLHSHERQLLLALANAFEMPPDSTRQAVEGFPAGAGKRA